MICERSSTKGCYTFPTCVAGKQEVKLIIKYNECDKDILYLCKFCAEAIEKDAINHNYEVKVIKERR